MSALRLMNFRLFRTEDYVVRWPPQERGEASGKNRSRQCYDIIRPVRNNIMKLVQRVGELAMTSKMLWNDIVLEIELVKFYSRELRTVKGEFSASIFRGRFVKFNVAEGFEVVNTNTPEILCPIQSRREKGHESL